MREHKEDGIFLKKQLYNELIIYIQEVENKLEELSGSGLNKRPTNKMPKVYIKLLKEGRNVLNHMARGFTTEDK